MQLWGILIVLIHGTRSLECDGEVWKKPLKYETTASIDPNAKLNVHLIPHSHDDPGWIKTVDEYYIDQVQYILDTVVEELQKDPNRQFVFVEQSFFQRWWAELNAKQREIVKRLVVETHQLDLSVNGGWCMHDEATPHFSAMFDQTRLGHAFLKQEFNVTPTIGWQIDPFGHSATQATLLSYGLGFEGLYFARIDYEDYAKRKAARDLEFIWRPKGKIHGQVFTGVIQDHYGAPDGFVFSTDQAINDDPALKNYNVCQRLKDFIHMCLERAKWTRGNHIFLPMGGDFAYVNALPWFKNMDKLIHYGNKEGQIHVLYSNLSYYTRAKNAEKIQWSIKTDDFFPYADQAHSYWTGFFTSRPTLKRYARVANGFLQAMRQIEVLTNRASSKLIQLEKAVGLVQHHDGLSGTEKQVVAYDYAERLSDGMQAAEKLYNDLFAQNGSTPFEFCWLSNISRCSISEKATDLQVRVYNPLPRERIAYLRIPVDNPHFHVKPASVLSSDPWLTDSIPLPYQPIYAKFMLTVPVKMKGLAFETLWLTSKADSAAPIAVDRRLNSLEHKDDRIKLENDHIQVTFSAQNGSIVSYLDKKTGRTHQVSSGFYYYRAHQGKKINSGAYIFRPETDATWSVVVPEFQISSRVSQNEIHFQLSSWVSVSYRLYPTDEFFQIEWSVGPIPIDDGFGKEVIFQFNSSIASKDTWYTDSNGLDFMERRRNFRPSWNLTVTEPVAGNYYPMTTGVYLKDRQDELSILTDRAQGVASLASGSLEVMIHRRLLKDDYKGVAESLNETEILPSGEEIGLRVRGLFSLSIDSVQTGAKSRRNIAALMFFPPLPAFRHHQKNEISTINSPVTLPDNIQLDTFTVVSKNVVLVGLRHVGETPTVLDLSLLFPNRTIQNIRSTQVKPKLQWNTATPEMISTPTSAPPLALNEFKLHFNSKMTQTFEINLI